jgi:hypothetical protein
MRIRRLAAPVLVSLAVIVGSGLPSVPGVRAATPPESDIPGIALLGPAVSGRLGGPIYDVVYRVDVPPGYIIVAGLSGTAGSDFDLYLFDSTATTVVSNQGLLAKSTGPASSERLSFPSFAGGTYYIDLNGVTDVEGTYTLTVQLVPDQSAPIASLLLADGNPTANTTIVKVRLTAFAGLAGIAEMAFSPDGVTFRPWESYTIETTWTFPAGDGTKTLWAKVRSGTGVESVPTRASYVLDTAPPALTAVVPVPDSSVADLRPAFTVRFNEPADPLSWTQLGLVVQAATGQPIVGAYAYDPSSRTGTFRPNADLSPGTVCIVTVGQVRDVAGNTITPLPSWTVTLLQPTSLSISVSPGLVAAGSGAVVSGTAVGLDGADVILEARQGAATGTNVLGLYKPVAGKLSVALVPAMNTSYRWRFVGTQATAAAAQSPEVRVLVRRPVSLMGVVPSTTRTVRSGTRVTLTARVAPSGAGARLSFQLYRYDATRRAYVQSRSFGRTADANGRATLVWTPTTGRYYWRVAVPSTPQFANSISPAYRWSVSP